ncbi:MAG TPA: (2Fe-2S)-binding protein [Kiritimatiellia bacterium]|jgi:carbon-monoxide dehydrogenase small subunit|nr:(2Fe-2S)-binding protein [Lentisphaerota bacterium]HRV31416.1 (2Fe-2S)-binding protein [Kiritimatiellia bacterium]
MSNVQRTWTINGKQTKLRFPPGRRLLDILRDDLGLTGSKESCGEGECGACTVLVNKEPVVSCILPAGQLVNGTDILTIEGIEKKRIGRVIQQAFLECGAVQCGFCIPGMVVAAYALLIKNPKPSVRAIREALAGNLCRCTGYTKIIQAVKLAATRMPQRK